MLRKQSAWVRLFLNLQRCLPEFQTWLRLQQRKGALRHRAAAHHNVSCALGTQPHGFCYIWFLCLA